MPGHHAESSASPEQSDFGKTGGDGAERDGNCAWFCSNSAGHRRLPPRPLPPAPCREAGSQGCPAGLRQGPVIGLGASLPSHPILIPLGGEKSGWDKRHKPSAPGCGLLTSAQAAGTGHRPQSPRCCHTGGRSRWPGPRAVGVARWAGGMCWHVGVPSMRGIGHGRAAWHWHGSAGRQRDELIHRLGAAAVQQSSCFSVKSPTPCLEKNKWERSRCLALCRAAARAQPLLSVENTDSRAGPVRTHKPMKANSKNSP